MTPQAQVSIMPASGSKTNAPYVLGPQFVGNTEQTHKMVQKLKELEDAQTAEYAKAAKEAKAAVMALATKAKGKGSSKDDKAKDSHLRPSTPTAQIGLAAADTDGLSPCSQAVESGTVTPNSEGVKRKDRNTWHAPPGY